ncbi:MAG: hypothetical protein L6428_15910 [Candidatus Aminicenantes bacterium]|nr:hypothetical protein [Acidobacteriota bacterium]MCG2812919.1 hypothetical protein [Candidatus Aminicenantes bacterium]
MKKSRMFLKIALALIFMARLGGETMFIDRDTQDEVREYLLGKYGEEQKFRINRGVQQTAAFWRAADGSAEEFSKFCKTNFIADPERLQTHFKRIETNFESLYGHLNKISLDLKRPLQLDWGKILPIDQRFGRLDPTAHISDDLFETQIAFDILLNFPAYSLAEKTELGPAWNRCDWAYVRCGDLFLSRLPARVSQNATAALNEAETYISEYNIHMGRLLDNQGKTLFPENLKLISHWGLRDHLKGLYAEKHGLAGQEMIYEVLKRIIQQDIPKTMVNRRDFFWNPFKNKVYKDSKEIGWTPEPNTRYLQLLNIFKAMKEMDEHFPSLPSHAQRKFELERELEEAAMEKLFEEVLTSAQVKDTAALVEKRLGRKLKPFDIWYNGFKPRAKISQAELNRRVGQKYADLKAFEKDMRAILQELGFPAKSADFIAARIAVDPARGAGHAWGAMMRSERSRLRTRPDHGGMSYQSFNIAMHELGHCVEQTLALHKVDSYMLAGVPNTAISEAFAFIFQSRDLEILGLKNETHNARQLKTLDTLWMTCEIAAVALVDMQVWNWLYKNPGANPEALRKAVMHCARQVWNKYYAPIFGVRDQIILAAYSHLIDAALYLPDYPLGHLISFQLESHLAGKNLGTEMERMCQAGRIIPQLWMKNAVGEEISAAPLLEAAAEALKVVKK